VSLLLKTSIAFDIKPILVERKIENFRKCFDVTFSPSTSYEEMLKINNHHNQIHGGDVNSGYHFFHVSGTLMTSVKNTESSLCYDPQDCYYLYIHGHSKFTLLEGKEIMKEGSVRLDNPFLFPLGECNKECEGNNLIVAGIENDNYTIYNETSIIEDEMFDKPSLKKTCVKPDDCYKVQGTVGYYYYKVDLSFEEGNTNLGYRAFGICSSKCDDQPKLGESQRGRDILQVLTSISGLQAMINTKTPQYEAACWLIYEDLRNLNATDHTLLQRYILMLVYFSTNGKNWVDRFGFHSPRDECHWFKLTFDPTYGKYSANFGIKCNDFNKVHRIHLVSWLRDLVYLNFVSNELKGNIPNLNQLKKLKNIFFHLNFFTGTIPTFLPPKLLKIVVDGNFLSGTLPNFNGNLRTIRMYDNLFSGTIPESIVTLKNLEWFKVQKNQLNGTIPSQFLMLPNLKQTNLGHNLLTGTIPSKVANTSKLQWLFLNHNFLTGQIPSQLSNAVGLTLVSLRNNVLSGEIPFELAQLENIEQLSIQFNNLTGIVPFQDCSKFLVLESDCDSPQKVNCKCCTGCFGIFTAPSNIEECSEGLLRLDFGVDIGQIIGINITNTAGEIIERYHRILAKETLIQYTKCISVTDCFILTFVQKDIPRYVKAFLDETEVFEKNLNYTEDKVYFGYSSTQVMNRDTCDAFLLCNVAFGNSTKRYLVNKIVKRTSYHKIQKETSDEYSAACAFVNFLDIQTDDILLKSELLQRYFLSLIYFATNGRNWKNKDLWLSNKSFCMWYGIACDNYDMVIGISLSSNNIIGYIPSEIGELRSLQFINLSDNSLSTTIPKNIANLESLKQFFIPNNRVIGSLPSQISFLQKLVDLDVSHNLLSSYIPEEIGMVESLENLTLANNSFSGDLPNSFYNLRRLKWLDLAKNLLAGEVSKLGILSNLEHLDLRSNFFKGKLPLGELHKNMEFVELSNNQFNGPIPLEIGEMRFLKYFMLQNNVLTGTIPTQLGILQNLSHVSLAYNNFKGSMPNEMFVLENLTFLHLHRNDIVGNADKFDYKIESYITDCGSTTSKEAMISCKKCTFCCNDFLECQDLEAAWPHGLIAESKISAAGFVSLVTISFFLAFIIFNLVLIYNDAGNKLRSLKFARNKFQTESVYKFLLTNDWVAIFFALLILVFHFIVLYMFLDAADSGNTENEAAYKYQCSSNSYECSTSSQITFTGTIIFTIMLLIFLASDFIDGFLLIYESLRLSDKRGVLTAVTVLFITTYSFLVSLLFNVAIGVSNIEIMANAAILLFLNDIDEKVFYAIKCANPDWVKQLESYILRTYSDPAFLFSDANEDSDSDYDPSDGENSNSGNFNENETLRKQVEKLQKQVNFLSTHFFKNQNKLPTQFDKDEKSDKEDNENLKPISSRADNLHEQRRKIDELQQQINDLCTTFVKIKCDLISDVDEVEKSKNDEEFENMEELRPFQSQTDEFQSQGESRKIKRMKRRRKRKKLRRKSI